MSVLVWDKSGERFYETGVDHGVMYPHDDAGQRITGVAWNGLTAVTDRPSGGEPTALWADNIKYCEMVSAQEHGITIETYQFPDEFYPCLGMARVGGGAYVSMQAKRRFDFSWRTRIGNDIMNDKLSYKLHIVYNCLAGPSEQNHQTVNESPDAQTMSFECTTLPVEVDYNNMDPSAKIVISAYDMKKANKEANLKAIEALLYGSENNSPRLPDFDQIIQLLAADSTGIETLVQRILSA